MKKLKAFLTWPCFVLLSTSVFAQGNHQFVIYHHNIESIDPKITDEECNKLFSEPVFYNIVGDTPHYKDTSYHKNKTYKRISTTFLDSKRQLFLGTCEFDATHLETPIHLTQYMYFQLDLEKRMIRGGWMVPGRCKGNLIGVDQQVHQWKGKKP